MPFRPLIARQQSSSKKSDESSRKGSLSLRKRRIMRLAIDSGAHSLYNHVIKRIYGKGQRYSVNDYWKSDQFQEYVEHYAKFLKSYQDTDVIDWYVSVDVIFDPEGSWEVQRILESQGLTPMPVYHYGESRSHLIKMIDNYEYVGIGGVGQDVTVEAFIKHGDAAFKLLSDDKGYPIRKTHGFALTSNKILWRYPFYTVDSSSWVQFSQYGIILVPFKRNGEWYYGKPFSTDGKPQEVIVSSRATPKPGSKHFSELSARRQMEVVEWLTYLGVPLGKSNFKEVSWNYTLKKDEKFVGAKEGRNDRLVEERPIRGVVNDHEWRDINNYLYYMHLESALPAWPWSSTKWLKPINIVTPNHPRPPHQDTTPDRTHIIMGGNFDLQVYKHKEERMRRLIMSHGFDYNRMVSFFFAVNNIFDGSDKTKNILEVKEEWLRKTPSTSPCSTTESSASTRKLRKRTALSSGKSLTTSE